MLDYNLRYTEREKEFFNYLFNSNKKAYIDYIEGPEFAMLMKKSNLDKVIVIFKFRLNLDKFGNTHPLGKTKI